MSRRTGSGGRSKATRKPPRCSSARTAASARIRTGTCDRRGSRNEIANRSRGSRRLRGSGRLRAESVVFVSARRQHAELAESRTEERAREVQESAAALLDSRRRPDPERERGAAGSGPSSYGRNSRRARRRAVVEGRLVVGGQ